MPGTKLKRTSKCNGQKTDVSTATDDPTCPTGGNYVCCGNPDVDAICCDPPNSVLQYLYECPSADLAKESVYNSNTGACSTDLGCCGTSVSCCREGLELQYPSHPTCKDVHPVKVGTRPSGGQCPTDLVCCRVPNASKDECCNAGFEARYGYACNFGTTPSGTCPLGVLCCPTAAG